MWHMQKAGDSVTRVEKNTHKSSNHPDTMTSLNTDVFSHQRSSKFSEEILGVVMSCSVSYRDKIATVKRHTSDHDAIKEVADRIPSQM